MYPAQTSFIPVQIALARFLENQGWRAVFSNYPYWYLGTTPFRYLAGPILPSLLVMTHKFLSFFSPLRESAFPITSLGAGHGTHSRSVLGLFEIFWGWLGVFWLIGGVGVYWLVKELANFSTSEDGIHQPPRFSLARAAAIFYLFGPIVPFLFRFSDGLSLMAFSVLPWVLGWYARWLGFPSQARKNSTSLARSEKGSWGLLGLMTLAILLDTSVIPSLFLGMVAVFLATTGWKKAEEKIKRTLLVTIYSLLITTLWYSPGYWWQLITAPSFAGKPLFRVIGLLGQLLPAALAITLAVISGKFFKPKPKAKFSLLVIRYSLLKFTFYWLFIFCFLTLVRFISDPDFWLDWSSYGIELQLGLAVLGGWLVGRLSGLQKYQISNIKYQNGISKLKIFTFLLVVFTFYILLFTFVFDRYVLGTLQEDLTQTVEYRVGNQLSEIAKPGEKIFLSGSTVFWLNAFFDLVQVRGGVDPVSVHPTWREAAWEIREGTNSEKSIKALKELGVDYLVVHTQDSEEFWHDFKQPEKFQGVEGLEKIYDEKGDRIYRVLEIHP